MGKSVKKVRTFLKYGIGFLAVTATACFLFFTESGFEIYKNADNLFSSIFLIDSITAGEIRTRYANAAQGTGKVKILVVPGHDDDYWGTEYRGLREAGLNLELGKMIFDNLKQDPNFQVFITRNESGYLPEFSLYFENQKEEIKKFRNQNIALTKVAVKTNVVAPYEGVMHNNAAAATGIKLYGINKWANENKIDIVIHVHFNDDGIRRSGRAGEFSGFAIYVPEKQLSNSRASIALAKSVLPKFGRYFPMSNMPRENIGIVEDQDLIAIGSNNTLESAALLFEYAYIYEPQVANSLLRKDYFKELAFQTYSGIENFFGKDAGGKYQTTLLPHSWEANLGKNSKSADILSLQAALGNEKLYPPGGSSFNDCPISGVFGSCTERALKSFQEKYAIVPAIGYLGEFTRLKLNGIYSR